MAHDLEMRTQVKSYGGRYDEDGQYIGGAGLIEWQTVPAVDSMEHNIIAPEECECDPKWTLISQFECAVAHNAKDKHDDTRWLTLTHLYQLEMVEDLGEPEDGE